MFKQIAFYNFLAAALAVNSIACAQQSNNAAARSNKSTTNNQTKEQTANYDSNQTNKTAAVSGEKQAANNQCTTWTDVKAADKAKRIYASSGYQAIPELPEGFKNGCVYSSPKLGPSALALIVLKDGLRITPAAVDDEMGRIIPPYNEDEGTKLEDKGQTLEIGFYSDDERIAAAGGDRTAKHAQIDKEKNTVFFDHQSMQSKGASLEEMARLLEVTTKGRLPRRQTK